MGLLVVSCFRVHLYKNMYQANLQQCLINAHFLIISGCQRIANGQATVDALGWSSVHDVKLVEAGGGMPCPSHPGSGHAPWQPQKSTSRKETLTLSLGTFRLWYWGITVLSPGETEVRIEYENGFFILSWLWPGSQWWLSCCLIWQGSSDWCCPSLVQTLKSAISPRSPSSF